MMAKPWALASRLRGMPLAGMAMTASSESLAASTTASSGICGFQRRWGQEHPGRNQAQHGQAQVSS